MKGSLKSIQTVQTKQVVSKKSIKNRVEIFFCVCVSYLWLTMGSHLIWLIYPVIFHWTKLILSIASWSQLKIACWLGMETQLHLSLLALKLSSLNFCKLCASSCSPPPVYVSSNVYQSCYGQKTLFPWCHPSSLTLKILFIIALWALRERI